MNRIKLLFDENINDTERRLYCLLYNKSDENGSIKRSVKELKRETSWHFSEVSLALSGLQENGYISSEFIKKGLNEYKILNKAIDITAKVKKVDKIRKKYINVSEVIRRNYDSICVIGSMVHEFKETEYLVEHDDIKINKCGEDGQLKRIVLR